MSRNDLLGHLFGSTFALVTGMCIYTDTHMPTDSEHACWCSWESHHFGHVHSVWESWFQSQLLHIGSNFPLLHLGRQEMMVQKPRSLPRMLNVWWVPGFSFCLAKHLLLWPFGRVNQRKKDSFFSFSLSHLTFQIIIFEKITQFHLAKSKETFNTIENWTKIQNKLYVSHLILIINPRS